VKRVDWASSCVGLILYDLASDEVGGSGGEASVGSNSTRCQLYKCEGISAVQLMSGP
jgi:hypothetical protein